MSVMRALISKNGNHVFRKPPKLKGGKIKIISSNQVAPLTIVYIPDEFAAKEHARSDGEHVPVGAAAVFHDVKCHGDVTVAVVATEVVHTSAVDVRGLRDTRVPTGRAT